MVIELVYLLYTIINNVLKIFFIHRLNKTELEKCNCDYDKLEWKKSFVRNFSVFKLILQILAIVSIFIIRRGLRTRRMII